MVFDPYLYMKSTVTTQNLRENNIVFGFALVQPVTAAVPQFFFLTQWLAFLTAFLMIFILKFGFSRILGNHSIRFPPTV